MSEWAAHCVGHCLARCYGTASKPPTYFRFTDHESSWSLCASGPWYVYPPPAPRTPQAVDTLLAACRATLGATVMAALEQLLGRFPAAHRAARAATTELLHEVGSGAAEQVSVWGDWLTEGVRGSE